MPLWRARPLGFCCVLLGCVAAAGCRSSVKTALDAPAARNLEKIGDAYLRATQQKDKPPQGLDDLLPALKEQTTKESSRPEDLLRSPNDDEKYEIVWGVELRRMKATGNDVPIIAFEKRGKDGQRYVLRGQKEVLLMSESQLRSATFPEGYKLPF